MKNIKNCYLISNRIIEPALSNESPASIDPIVAIQYFFGSQQRNTIALDLYDDVTIIDPYTIAKNETEKHAGARESQLNTFDDNMLCFWKTVSKNKNRSERWTSWNQQSISIH